MLDIFNDIKRMSSGCVCGESHSMATGTVYVGSNAAEKLRDFAGAYRSPLLVCDTNTEKYASLFPGFDKAVLPGNSHANELGTSALLELIRNDADLLIACGSGSIHDITRYCADKRGLPFVSFPTAASVDGFVSTVAAMTWRGQKLSSPAAAPIALFADVEVYSDAPARLTASGVGDLLGKYTALTDWRIAQILTGEKLCPGIYSLMSGALEKLELLLERRAAGEISADSAEYTTLVMESLVLAGLAMQLQGNSRPASGSEHHLSHLWEMHVINKPTKALHGEQVGVAALLLTKFYHAHESFDFTKKRDLAETFDRGYIGSAFGELTDGILAENLTDGDPRTSSLNFSASDGQSKLAGEEISKLITPERLERYLKIAGAPTTTAELGLPDSPEFIERTLAFAPYVRKRLTLLKIIEAK